MTQHLSPSQFTHQTDILVKSWSFKSISNGRSSYSSTSPQWDQYQFGRRLLSTLHSNLNVCSKLDGHHYYQTYNESLRVNLKACFTHIIRDPVQQISRQTSSCWGWRCAWFPKEQLACFTGDH